MELYRYLSLDFVIQYCKKLAKRDFTFKTEQALGQKMGKREYLNYVETKDFAKKRKNYFETTIKIPRRKVGLRQTLETLISDEALFFARYLRSEKKEWLPRISI